MMQEELGQNFQGVEIPPETVVDSNAKKAKRVRTLAELPVGRDAVNLLAEIAQTVMNGPNSLRKHYYFYIRNHHDSIRTRVKYRPINQPFAMAA